MAIIRKYIAITANGTWTVPDDWNSSNNIIECIGAGGSGADVADGSGAGGGGGGAYAAVANVTLTPGATVYIRIGSGGGGAADGNTWVNWVANSAPNATANGVLAAHGVNGSGLTGGIGGTTANSIGTIEFAGGTGGNGNATGDTGGGGGGAAGPGGAGKNGGTGGTGASDGGGGGGGAGGGSSTAGSGTTTNTGGAGGNGPAGTGSGAGATGTGTGTAGTAGTGSGGGGGGGTAGTGGNGGSGSDLGTISGVVYGAGGGGGGNGDNNAAAGTPGGGNGGLYGGGGGRETGGAGGLGAPGVVFIEYTATVNDLYWRNGANTWNATNYVSWALTSGGAASNDAGSGAVPDATCNARFDANADAGSNFAVTIGPGAVCNSLIISDLDKTMTLQQSIDADPLSIYGNLSLTSANLTYSYTTPKITFFGNSNSTFSIDTAGKLMGPLDFNDISPFIETQKLTASDTANSDDFGISVSISGNTAVVGAQFEDDAGSNRGAAYVFTLSGGVWTEQQKLTASDAADSDFFGISVAIYNNTIVVGATGHENPGGSANGAAYVFTRSGGVWTQQQILTASDGLTNDNFGYSVSIYEDNVIVGSYLVGTDRGAAYAYKRSGGTWTEQQKLTASDAADSAFFGESVAIYKDTAVIGATNANSNGAVYVFTSSGDAWEEQQKIVPSDPTTSADFGISVDIYDDTIVVGSDRKVTQTGAAYVFRKSNDTWTQEAKLTASDAATTDFFGRSVSIFGDTIIVGAFSEDGAGTNRGAAYAYKRSGSTWTQVQKIIASDPENTDQFGIFVKLNANNLIIGANLEDGAGTDRGAAYMFTNTNAKWRLSNNITTDTDTSAITLLGGSFDANNYSINTGSFIANTINAKTITMGSGTWELRGTGAIWNVNPTGLISYPNTSNIYLSATSTTQRTFTSYDASYYKLTIGGTTGNTNTAFIGSNNSFYEFGSNKTVAHQIYFREDSNARMNLFTANGSSGNLVQLRTIANTSSIVTSNLVLWLDAANTSSYTGAPGRVVNANLWFDTSGQTVNGNTNFIFRNPGGSMQAHTTTTPKYIALRHYDVGQSVAEFNSNANDFIDIIVQGNSSPMQIRTDTANAYENVSRTMEMWVRLVDYPGSPNTTSNTTATSNSTAIFGGEIGVDGILLAIQYGTSNTQYQISWRWDDSTITGSFASNTILNVGDWYHIACVLNPPIPTNSTWQYRATYFINGVADKTITSDDVGGVVATDQQWVIGRSDRGFGIPTTGPWWNRYTWMDVSIVRFYRRNLTNSEILQNYNAEKSRFFNSYHNLEKLGSDVVSVDYLDIQNSNATPNTITWYAGANSLNAKSTFIEQAKLTVPNPAASDFFGWSVAISGDYIISCAYSENGAGSDRGAAYIFYKNGDRWAEQQELTASDAADGDQFGWSVDIDGDTAVIGANLEDAAGTNRGAAYVFTRSGTTWTEQQKLTASDGEDSDQFAEVVAISADTVAVGAPLEENPAIGTNRGAVYVFTRSAGVWSEQQKITASDGANLDRFGNAVDIDGDTLIVGSPYDEGAGAVNTGSVYVYTRSGGTWTQQQKLTASDAANNDQFGISVAVLGDTAVIGADLEDGAGTDRGAAYVFTRSGGTWTEQQKLIASDAADNSRFGLSVDIDNNIIIVGAWADDFGAAANTGSIYVFEKAGSTWVQTQKIVAGDAQAFDAFSYGHIGISNNRIVAGAYSEDGSTTSGAHGAAYVFEASPNNVGWIFTASPAAPSAGTGSFFVFFS